MKLLSPVRMGFLNVKNRVVSTSHSAFGEFFKAGDSGERYIAYQERRAKGGAGLLILTAMHVHWSSSLPFQHVYDPLEMPPKFEKLARRIHSHGAKVIAQLFHSGVQAKSDSRPDLNPLWGFSAIASSTDWAIWSWPRRNS